MKRFKTFLPNNVQMMLLVDLEFFYGKVNLFAFLTFIWEGFMDLDIAK